MRKLLMPIAVAATLSVAASTLFAQTTANEHNCPSTQAIPPFVGPGSSPFSANQSLCLPQLSGWPSYLKGSVPLLFGGPSSVLFQRHRSTPPGTPRMETT